MFVPFLTLGTQGGKQDGGDGTREGNLKVGNVVEKGNTRDLGEEVRSVDVDVDRTSVKDAKADGGEKMN